MQHDTHIWSTDVYKSAVPLIHMYMWAMLHTNCHNGYSLNVLAFFLEEWQVWISLVKIFSYIRSCLEGIRIVMMVIIYDALAENFIKSLVYLKYPSAIQCYLSFKYLFSTRVNFCNVKKLNTTIWQLSEVNQIQLSSVNKFNWYIN